MTRARRCFLYERNKDKPPNSYHSRNQHYNTRAPRLTLQAFPKVSLPSRSKLRRVPKPANQLRSRSSTKSLTSAAAIVVNSAFVSYAGATSTMSAETMWRPSKPLKIVRNSRVDHPPVSGVPVAGAKAGSIESICVLSYEIASRKLPARIIHLIRTTHIDGEINGLVADDLADLLDDPIRAWI